MKKLRDKILDILADNFSRPFLLGCDPVGELFSLFAKQLTKELEGMRMEKRKTFNLVYDGGFNQAVKEQNTKIEKRIEKIND